MSHFGLFHFIETIMLREFYSGEFLWRQFETKLTLHMQKFNIYIINKIYIKP